MLKKSIVIAILAIVCVMSYAQKSGVSKESDAVFKNGDRVAFVGNSITHRGYYWSYVMLYYTTRFPERAISFFDLGISGNLAKNLVDRMQSDILVVNPTVASVMIGMNDVASRNKLLNVTDSIRRMNIPIAYDKYKTNCKIVYDTLRARTRKMILLTPSIYDQTAKIATQNNFGANDELYAYGELIKVTAPKYNATVVDMWAGMMAVNKAVQAKDSTATIVGKDRVHPDVTGSFVMAYQFLKDTKVPQYVSQLSIDTKLKKAIVQDNCELSALKVGKDELRFTLFEHALPFPYHSKFEQALNLVPFTEKFNQEKFIVKGLNLGTYKLLVDEREIGRYTANELAKGVNLAINANTPQYKQAIKVMDLCIKYQAQSSDCRDLLAWDISFGKNIDKNDVALCIEKAKEAMTKPENSGRQQRLQTYIANKPKQKEMNEQLPIIAKEIYQVNQPVKHNYQLIKINE